MWLDLREKKTMHMFCFFWLCKTQDAQKKKWQDVCARHFLKMERCQWICSSSASLPPFDHSSKKETPCFKHISHFCLTRKRQPGPIPAPWVRPGGFPIIIVVPCPCYQCRVTQDYASDPVEPKGIYVRTPVYAVQQAQRSLVFLLRSIVSGAGRHLSHVSGRTKPIIYHPR